MLIGRKLAADSNTRDVMDSILSAIQVPIGSLSAIHGPTGYYISNSHNSDAIFAIIYSKILFKKKSPDAILFWAPSF